MTSAAGRYRRKADCANTRKLKLKERGENFFHIPGSSRGPSVLYSRTPQRLGQGVMRTEFPPFFSTTPLALVRGDVFVPCRCPRLSSVLSSTQAVPDRDSRRGHHYYSDATPRPVAFAYLWVICSSFHPSILLLF